MVILIVDMKGFSPGNTKFVSRFTNHYFLLSMIIIKSHLTFLLKITFAVYVRGQLQKVPVKEPNIKNKLEFIRTPLGCQYQIGSCFRNFNKKVSITAQYFKIVGFFHDHFEQGFKRLRLGIRFNVNVKHVFPWLSVDGSRFQLY